MVGCEHLIIGIAASAQLAEQIAAAMLMCEPAELEAEDIDDALGEFLNLVMGSAKTAAGADITQDARLSSPRSTDFPSEGFGLNPITNQGPGCLLIQTQPSCE